MKTILALTISAILLLLTFCTKNDPVSPGATYNNYVSFDSLKVGQRSRFLHFTITDDTKKNYDADTLIFEINSKTDSGFVVHEYFTNGSISKNQENSARKFLLKIQNDTIIHFLFNYLDFGSRLLGQNGYCRFPMSYQSDGTFDPDTLRPSYCMDHPFKGTVDSISLHNATFKNLNIINDNDGISADGAGYIYVFSRQHGFVSVTVYAGFTPDPPDGWEFLPY
jgi:hypothetical protein